MNHADQVLALLKKQIGNNNEVADIAKTANEVTQKWIDPLSGGKEETNGLVYGLVQSGKTGVLSVTGAMGADEGYKTVMILTSDNDALYAQTLTRIHDIPELRRSQKVAALIRDIPKNGGSRSDLPRSRQLACHKKSDGFKDIYGRMAWDKVAPTITGGCFNPSKGRFLHPVENRAITMREAALLQGFPRRYIFDTKSGKQRIALMIGNALPPEFIRRHALAVAQALPKRSVR